MSYNVTEVIETILHSSLHRYKVKNSRAALPLRVAAEKAEKKSGYKKGVVFATRSKEDLRKAKGLVISSVEALEDNQDCLTHWTPNPFRFGTYIDEQRKNFKGHEETNLKQINCFVVDIDLKNEKNLVTKEDILITCLDMGFLPTLILDTPNGYHVYFVLNAPYFVSNKNEFRGLKIARRIAENLANSLAKDLKGVDVGCNPFGFFRMPSSTNILYFAGDTTYTWAQFMFWSEAYDHDRNRSLFSIVSSSHTKNRQVDQEWFQTIIRNQDISKGHELGRNNTVLTLSLACYQSGITFDDCYNLLDQFNSNLGSPLSNRDIMAIIKSAYSGKYKAASPIYINKLLEIWGDGTFVSAHPTVFKHVKKERKDRVRSHLDEWEEDILQWLKQKVEKGQAYVYTTQRQICEETGIPKSTLNKLLKTSTKIKRQVVKGQKGQTALCSFDTMIQAILFNKTLHTQHYADVTMQLFPASRMIANELFVALNLKVAIHKNAEKETKERLDRLLNSG